MYIISYNITLYNSGLHYRSICGYMDPINGQVISTKDTESDINPACESVSLSVSEVDITKHGPI